MATTNLMELLETIEKANGQFGSLVVQGPHKMRKKNNPLDGRVEKLQTITIRLQSYRSAKARQTDTPLDQVEVKAPNWSEHVSRFVIRHKGTGQLYFQTKPESVSGVQYLVDGKPATADELQTIQEHTPQKEGGTPWICVKLENIKHAAIGGEVYDS